MDSVELSSKALLLEVPKQPGRASSRSDTAGDRGSARHQMGGGCREGGKTSVFVVDGRVSVARPAGGGRSCSAPGEGVDVEATGDLTVKRWAPRASPR